jgi:HAD superfamily hydrolase (TIGR01450 family)
LTTVLCDLDGVVYRGDSLIAGSDLALKRLIAEGVEVYFVTNNSTRHPRQVVAKIRRVTGLEFEVDRVFTSPQAGVAMLGEGNAPSLVIGEEGIRSALDEAGLEITQDPIEARSVIVGLDRGVDYPTIAAAAKAVRLGARFIATNDDPTYPTADGLLPGAGAIVAAIATAAGQSPEVAGKPNPPMRNLIRSRGIGDAWIIGDRVDTDIAMAVEEEGWRSILVLSGVTTEPSSLADMIAADLREAVDLLMTPP